MKKLFLLVLISFATALSLSAQTSHSVNLSWTASTTTGAQYNIYRGTVSGGPYTKLNSGAISGTNFNDTTGTAGTKYFYVVTAVCGSTATCPAGITGESAPSAEASATFLGNPNPVTGLTATPQ